MTDLSKKITAAVPLFRPRHLNLIREFSLCWFKLRDQRSILGLLWSFLNPLMMTAILYFLFRSRMDFGDDRSYFMYILVGSVAWNYFALSIEGSLNILVRKAYLMRNAVFPKEILVFSQIGVYLIQHLLELLVVFGFILVTKTGVSRHILALPYVILIEGFMILGITLFLSCLCVYARDTEHIWSVFTRMAFFMVPIFYKPSALSGQFRWVIALNPMTQIINFYRNVLLDHRWPDGPALLLTSLFAVLMLVSGICFFKKLEPHIVERA